MSFFFGVIYIYIYIPIPYFLGCFVSFLRQQRKDFFYGKNHNSRLSLGIKTPLSFSKITPPPKVVLVHTVPFYNKLGKGSRENNPPPCVVGLEKKLSSSWETHTTTGLVSKIPPPFPPSPPFVNPGKSGLVRESKEQEQHSKRNKLSLFSAGFPFQFLDYRGEKEKKKRNTN